MKKNMIICMISVLLFTLCGCGINNVETLANWSFQKNDGTSDYSLFFQLQDKNGTPVSAEADVDIKIIDNEGNTLYEGTKSVTKDDFAKYSNQIEGEMFLAEIRIPENEIDQGGSEEGKIYFKVYKENEFGFDECNLEIPYDLPVKGIGLNTDIFPMEVKEIFFDGSVLGKFRIDDVDYEVDKNNATGINITISGEKTYDGGLYSSNVFNYTLYDEEGFAVETGNVFLNQLREGQKFRDTSLSFYDLKPGVTYTLSFSDYK